MQRGFTLATAFAAVVVFIADLAVVGVHLLDEHTSLVNDRAAGRGTIGIEGARVVPSPGQVFVTGTAEKVVADGAQVRLTSPLTINAAVRGEGRLSIERALVSGRRSTISWDGGTPLPLRGTGGIELGATHVEIDGNGPVYSLDGAARAFIPGTYTLGATVAVGTTGVATPREGVQFTADSETVLTTRGGGVIVKLDPQKVDLVGPGKLALNGRLKVQYPRRAAEGTAVTFGEGPFRISVEPGAQGLTVDGILQGDVNVR